jgi:hypothetical protein
MNVYETNEERLDLVKSLKTVVERILKLDLNDEDEELQYCFKVLIFDDYVFEILCPLLKVIKKILFMKIIHIEILDLHIKRIQYYSSHEY